MAHDALSISTIEQQLRSLGVQPGQTLQVHTAFSEVGPVEGGPAGLIEALQATLGNLGTLAMPSMASDDDSPFDVQATPCLGMGVTAETFWRLPDVLRSDSPHAFAASGPLAGRITASHPLTLPHGPDSPVGRVHALEGQILLLGVGHAEARLAAAQAVVKVVVEQLTTDETAFLHPRGTDPECDEAWATMEM